MFTSMPRWRYLVAVVTLALIIGGGFRYPVDTLAASSGLADPTTPILAGDSSTYVYGFYGQMKPVYDTYEEPQPVSVGIYGSQNHPHSWSQQDNVNP